MDCLVGKTVVLKSMQGVMAALCPFIIMVPAPLKKINFIYQEPLGTYIKTQVRHSPS